LGVVSLVAAGCRAEADRGSAPAEPVAIQIGAENVVTVKQEEIVVGPLVSGQLRAAREATVRAQLAGSIEQLTVEEGQSVRKGAVLGRIEAIALEDTQRSIQTAVKSAEQQLDLAKREETRADQLVSAGALAARDLDVARANVSTVEAQLADTKARLVSIGQQLGDALLRAPITGIVSSRAVNTGDVVGVGAELFTIIDPSSMRLDASVPSDSLGALKIGAAVQFIVRGYDQRFVGQVERINPQADPATRQVPIYVAIPNSGGKLVAGLFAEGRLISAEAAGLVVPTNAVNATGATPWVLRVNGDKTERVDVTVGLRDDRTERLQIMSGVAEGDVLLRGAAQGITPGTPVRVNAAPPPTAAASRP
jgi:RND family efflux transporter MFP subunit